MRLAITLVCAAVMSMLACSCASVKDNSVTARPGAKETAVAGEFYVITDSLKLFPEPRLSGDCLDRLPLNEKVIRHGLSHGLAQVTVVRTGKKGWVDNGQLDWKHRGGTLVTEQKPTTAETPTAVPPEPVKAEPAKAEPVQAAPEKPAGEKKKARASVFDAY